MLIDFNKVSFDLNPSFGNWLDMYIDKEYIECVTLFEGDKETDEVSLGPLFYTYKVCAKLLIIRSCDSIYLANTASEYYSNDFQTVDLLILNKALLKLWN